MTDTNTVDDLLTALERNRANLERIVATNARLQAEIERLVSMEPWIAAEAGRVEAERQLREAQQREALLRARYERLCAAARKWAAQDSAVEAALWEGKVE